MTLTNRGTTEAMISYTYTAFAGGGTGTGTDTIEPGRQKIVPDAIEYLRSLGLPIPDSGSRVGTLRVRFSKLSAPKDAMVTVRTTSALPNGRAGLSYSGSTNASLLSGTAWLCGLRQNASDRSNVALQHAGESSDGDISLRLTVFSGDGDASLSQVLPDISLAPGAFIQISGILVSNGLSLEQGYVKVERVSGTAPYYAYAVINDQANSDGSFVTPLVDNSLAGKSQLIVPVIVEANEFSSELIGYVEVQAKEHAVSRETGFVS